MNTYWNHQKCLVALLCLLTIGCQKSAAERLAEEREKTKPVLVELERVILGVTGKLRDLQLKMDVLLTKADRAMLDGSGLTVSLLFKLEASTLASESLRDLRKTAYDAIVVARHNIRQMETKKEISKQTQDWALLECDKLDEKFETEQRATIKKVPG